MGHPTPWTPSPQPGPPWTPSPSLRCESGPRARGPRNRLFQSLVLFCPDAAKVLDARFLSRRRAAPRRTASLRCGSQQTQCSRQAGFHEQAQCSIVPQFWESRSRRNARGRQGFSSFCRDAAPRRQPPLRLTASQASQASQAFFGVPPALWEATKRVPQAVLRGAKECRKRVWGAAKECRKRVPHTVFWTVFPPKTDFQRRYYVVKASCFANVPSQKFQCLSASATPPVTHARMAPRKKPMLQEGGVCKRARITAAFHAGAQLSPTPSQTEQEPPVDHSRVSSVPVCMRMRVRNLRVSPATKLVPTIVPCSGRSNHPARPPTRRPTANQPADRPARRPTRLLARPPACRQASRLTVHLLARSFARYEKQHEIKDTLETRITRSRCRANRTVALNDAAHLRPTAC